MWASSSFMMQPLFKWSTLLLFGDVSLLIYLLRTEVINSISLEIGNDLSINSNQKNSNICTQKYINENKKTKVKNIKGKY